MILPSAWGELEEKQKTSDRSKSKNLKPSGSSYKERHITLRTTDSGRGICIFLFQVHRARRLCEETGTVWAIANQNKPYIKKKLLDYQQDK